MPVNWNLSRTVDPTTGPITLAEAKSHIRVVSTGDDTYIGTLIDAATERAEQITHRAFMRQTYALALDRFPEGEALAIPRPPLRSVSSISFVNTTGGTTSWSSTAYDVDTTSTPGRIAPKNGESWPTARDQINAVTITYVAGYSSSTSSTAQQAAVPARAKLGIQHLLADGYADRESSVVGTITGKIQTDIMRTLRSMKVQDSPNIYG